MKRLTDFYQRFKPFCWICFAGLLLPILIPIGLLLLMFDFTHPIGSSFLVIGALLLIPLFVVVSVAAIVALFFARSILDVVYIVIMAAMSFSTVAIGVYIMGQGG